MNVLEGILILMNSDILKNIYDCLLFCLWLKIEV